MPTPTRQTLIDFALTFPGAYLDHPWGEDVVKVSNRIFVHFGLTMYKDQHLFLVVKLPHTRLNALSMPNVKPAGLNLGKRGWLAAQYYPGDPLPPLDLFRHWIEESYRAMAPKRLVAQLDNQRPDSNRL